MHCLLAAITKSTVPKLATVQTAFTVSFSIVFRFVVLGVIVLSLHVPEIAIAQEIPRGRPRLDDAIVRGFKILRKGVENYPEHRSCFSCHHQALPLLAFSLDAVGSKSSSLEYWKLAQSIHQFTEASFTGKRELMRKGEGVGGKALTAAYGLWTMDLARAQRNETIDAMLEYLLKTQAEDGAWDFQSLRPPAASSRTMATAIAVYGLRAYGMDSMDSVRITEAFSKARLWADLADPTQSHEELIGLVWLDYMLDQEGVESKVKRKFSLIESEHSKADLVADRDPFIEGAFQSNRNLEPQDSKLEWCLDDLLARSQRDDGGWGQTPEMQSDAYATGQALLMLIQTGGYPDKKSKFESVTYRNGIAFLLRTQQEDGSWHVVTRSKPVQVFFDNGDPHGKDQFISMMATSWATAALANYRARCRDPLESFQVSERSRIAREKAGDPFGELLPNDDPFAP